ncbi:MAG: adenylate/guanylate cyclase domain-containing protein [Acidobacteriota bacterium]|nr:adenylate/guanylate cyclase domain-containing protein [Acidobacteriota bacterium]
MEKPSREALLAEIADLRAQLEEVRSEKEDLETMLEMTTEHSDAMGEVLHDRAEEALRQSEQRLRMIVEATPVPMMIYTADDYRVVFVNDMVGPALGVAADDMLGRTVDAFFGEPLPPAMIGGEEIDEQEMPIHRADGADRWVEISIRSLEFNEKPARLCAFHDITERKLRFDASSRFVPSEFLSFFNKDSIVELALGDFVSEQMAVMFSDVRSFTTISEGMTPRENFDFVNAYLKRVSPVVRECGGFIVKYLGDGIMAVFPRCADDAVRAGIEKLNRVNGYNAERKARGFLPIKIGVGIHTGHMMVGMVGEKNRMQGDAFSDDVNLSSRIEGLTKFYDAPLIISAETLQNLANPDAYCIRFLDKVRVRGRSAAVHLYEIYDADPEARRDLKLKTKDLLAEAQDLYYARKFREARVVLFRALQINPDDRLAWLYLVHTANRLENQPDENWTGVTEMTEK